jgi:hypothetical protein
MQHTLRNKFCVKNLVRKQHGRAIWLGNNMEEQYDIKCWSGNNIEEQCG